MRLDYSDPMRAARRHLRTWAWLALVSICGLALGPTVSRLLLPSSGTFEQPSSAQNPVSLLAWGPDELAPRHGLVPSSPSRNRHRFGASPSHGEPTDARSRARALRPLSARRPSFHVHPAVAWAHRVAPASAARQRRDRNPPAAAALRLVSGKLSRTTIAGLSARGWTRGRQAGLFDTALTVSCRPRAFPTGSRRDVFAVAACIHLDRESSNAMPISEGERPRPCFAPRARYKPPPSGS